MFEPISYNLSQLLGFAVLGFFLGLFYEPLRIIRLFKKQGVISVAVQDFVFLTLAGVVTFAYSMELGSGQFRLFFVLGELFGGVVYFLTLGKLISLFSNLIVMFIKSIYRSIKRYILAPVLSFMNKMLTFFGRNMLKIYNFVSKLIKKHIKHLKTSVKIRYNNNVSQNNITKKPKGVSKNVIKARITKKA